MSRPRRESTARVLPALIEPTAPTRSRSILITQISADRISASIASIFAPAFARRHRTARSGDALAGMDASTFRAFRNRGAFAPHEQTKTTTDDPSRRPSFHDAERATRSTADQASHSVPVGRSQSPRRLDGWPEETRHINIGARTVHWRRSHTRATLQALMWSGVVATSCWFYLRVSSVSGALLLGACVFVKASFDMLVALRSSKSESTANWYVEDANEAVHTGPFVTPRYGAEDGRAEAA